MTRGEYMRKARLNAGMSIKQLSEASGVARRTIGELERGISLGGWLITIELLADALGLSIDEYVGHRRQSNAQAGKN